MAGGGVTEKGLQACQALNAPSGHSFWCCIN